MKPTLKPLILWMVLGGWAAATLMGGCAFEPIVRGAVPAAQAPAPPATPKYIIEPGDELTIKFFYHSSLNETMMVRPDGRITLQIIDEVTAAGLTPGELDTLLTEAYSAHLQNPTLTVILRSFASQRVYVGGEVSRQGLVHLGPGMTVIQAVFDAGGFSETALLDETIVIRKQADNTPLPIRLDLAAAMRGQGNDAVFRLQPDDIVFVPKSRIARANKFVNQYVENLLLFRGISLGFSYKIDRSD